MPKLVTWRLGECIDPTLCTVGLRRAQGAAQSIQRGAARCSGREVHRQVQERCRAERCTVQRSVERCRCVERFCAAGAPNGAAVREALWYSLDGHAEALAKHRAVGMR